MPRVVLLVLWSLLWVVVGIGRDVLVAAQPTTSVVSGPVLPGEWILPAASADAWRAIEVVPSALGLRIEKREGAKGALVTKRAIIDPAVFGTLDTAGLPGPPVTNWIELHLHVMRDLEPARLAVGVVTESERGGVMSRSGRAVHVERRFGNAVLAARVVAAIESRLGVKAEPLSALPAGRAGQALRLMPLGVTGGCGTREAPMASPARRVERPPTRTRYEVVPAYPRAAREARTDGEVRVEAELTEHGTLVAPSLVGRQTTDDEFARATLGAFGLWRFTPLVQDGCPVRARLTLGSRFRFE